MVSIDELQEKIAELEAENALLDEIVDGVLAVDVNMKVIHYNKCFAQMWGLPHFDKTKSLYLAELKAEMVKGIRGNSRTGQAAQTITHNLLALDEEAADILDIPLENGRVLEQIFNAENNQNAVKKYVWGFRDVTRQRSISTELHQKEQFINRILHNAPLIIFSIAMDGTIEFLEGQESTIFGLNKASLIGTNVFDLSTIVTTDAIHDALQGQIVHRNEVYNPADETYSNATYYPLLDEYEEQIGVIGIIKNVTITHAEERKRRQQQQLLNRIIYNAPVLLIATDTEGNITFSRGKLLSRYNRRQAQDEGKNFFEVYGDHPMSDDVRAAINGVVTMKTHDFTMYAPGGYSEVTCSPLRDDDGQITGMVAIAVDITQQRESQIKLNRQSQYLDRILSNAPVVMFATDKTGILTFSRGAELRQFGLGQNELVGESILSGHQYHPLRTDVKRALNGEYVREIHAIGGIYLDMYFTPLLDRDANINGMIGVGVNVTDIKRAAEAIKQSQELRKAKEAAEAANIAKTTFIANMSHELRTPLNSIIGFSQFLVNDVSLSTQQQEYVSLISRSSEHLLGLINDILEMSKIETGKVDLYETNFDLFVLLEGMDTIYHVKASAKELTFELHIADTVPRYLFGDRNKLRQILINLLSNAVKYTDDGGIVLRAWLDEPEHPDQNNQFHLYFEVKDTGLGIGSHELDLLFDPFTQTKSGQQSAGGSGLGLVITRQFTQLMGGNIKVNSTEGKGTSFIVDVYLENASVVPEPYSSQNRRVIGIANDKAYKLLVVDDKWENRLMLVRTLQSVGFDVREASNGREAIKVWNEWQPDLIWMDMRMPIMNGYEATSQIREMAEDDVIIIALTASAFEHERREVLKAGCNDYMSKPFRNEELFNKMRRHLGVEFVYADDDDDDDEYGDFDETQLSLSMALYLLDEPLRQELRRAAVNYSLSSVLQVTEKIALQDKRIAKQVAQYARDFDFGRILKALGN